MPAASASAYHDWRYFEQRYDGDKWDFPFAQHFVMNWLDDYGALGAATTGVSALNRGYLEPRYASIAQRGWEGVVSRVRPDGRIEGICAGTTTSDDLVHYYQRPTLNDVHGIGTILTAGTEVLWLPQ